MENSTLYLIEKIRTAPLQCLTVKQLKSLLKIIEEYLTINHAFEKPMNNDFVSDIVKLRDEYEEYLKANGFVSIGIEYEWLNKLDNIIKKNN